MRIPVRLLPSDLPLDLSRTSRSTYGLIEEWATGLRLANAAASEQVIFASKLALELAPFCDEPHKGTFVWPNELQTLLVECFLTGRCLKHAFRVLCSVEWDELNVNILRALVSDNLYQSAVRLHLCSLWAATEFMLQSATLHDQAQSVLAKFADIAHTVAGSLQSLCTARDHFLLARLFSLLDSASGGCLPGVSKMVQLEHYETGVAIDGAYYVNHLFLGKLRREAGDVEEATISLYRAHELMPSSPEVIYQLALALCQNNELMKALDVYNSLDQNHFSKHMWIHYGLIAMRLKVSSLCVTAFQKVVMLDSENALYWELLGEAYLLRGSYKTALRALTRSILLDPTRPLAQIRFGQACRRVGDFELAIKHIASGLDCAFSQRQMKSVGQVVLLALQELIEVNLLVARAYLREGLLGSAVEKFQSVVKYLDQAFETCSSLKQPPLWIYHYAASAFSLFNGIDDVDFRVDLPHRFLLILRALAEQPVPTHDKMCLYTGLQLAGLYLACAYQRCLSIPKSQTTINLPESSIIVRGRLLISVALHFLYHSNFLRKHTQSSKRGTTTVPNADLLFRMTESALKCALSVLLEKAAKDQHLLEALQSGEVVAEVKMLVAVEASPWDFVRKRLAVNSALRAKAWYGLALLYSLTEDDFNELVNYCLCQALLSKPGTTEAGVSLALRMLYLGRTQFASSLLAHFQAYDPDNYIVWFACAYLNAVTGATETQPCNGIKPWACSNNTILKNLLQAACLGASVPVALHLVDNLFPLLVDAVSRPIYGESNITSSDHSKETRNFLRLAMEVATEALNRALAYEPQNPRLWHNRGLLLQLAGLSAPAEFCLRKAYSLFAGLVPSAQSSLDLQLACSQCFLITFIRGEPDWTLAVHLMSSTEDCNPTACASLSEALAKGVIYLYHAERSEYVNLASTCLVDEVLRLAQRGVAAATAVTLAFPNAGRWLLALYHLNQSRPCYLPLSQLFDLLSTGSSVPPQLARAITSLAVRLQLDHDLDPNAVATLQRFCHSQLQNAYQLSRHLENGFTGHTFYDQGQVPFTELDSWALDVATFNNLTSRRDQSGMAYLSKLVICQPDDPGRWIAHANWLVNHHILKTSENLLKLSYRSSKECQENSCMWKILSRIITTVLALRSDTPITSLFARTLTQCAHCYLADNMPPAQAETVVTVLFKGLRRAAALFPNTPGLLTQLVLFTARYNSHR
ncbi:hypothetical protein PHET_02913 [Paragonimus heterotremus]|uniref:Tetratricopeptide repeat protein 37 n=1 Tax=Paragonimus heterotremus TaxID=100268 RepID=A0A8J4TPK1_9TREM|nr:hypothetical protein PHET_02913 [Paragonimus heterotremus]